MRRRGLWIVLLIAGAIASFFVIVPFAEHFAQQHFGWNQSGQEAFGKFVFFPVLIGVLYLLRRFGTRRDGAPQPD